MPNKLKVTFKDWDYTCGDGCCFDCGTSLYIDDVHVSDRVDGAINAVIDLLKHLGYEVDEEYL